MDPSQPASEVSSRGQSTWALAPSPTVLLHIVPGRGKSPGLQDARASRNQGMTSRDLPEVASVAAVIEERKTAAQPV
ncbi:hypothetical protein H8959_022040 [Pygathrix nigripes]